MKSPTLYIGCILVLLTLAYAAPLNNENESDGDSWSEIATAKGKTPDPAMAGKRLLGHFSGHPEIAWQKAVLSIYKAKKKAADQANLEKEINKYATLNAECSQNEFPAAKRSGKPEQQKAIDTFYDTCVRCGDEMFLPQDVWSKWGEFPVTARKWISEWLYNWGKNFESKCFLSGAFVFEDPEKKIFNRLKGYHAQADCSPEGKCGKDKLYVPEVRGHVRITHACFMGDTEAESDQAFQSLEIPGDKLTHLCKDSGIKDAGLEKNAQPKNNVLFYHVTKSPALGNFKGKQADTGFTYVKLESEYTRTFAHAMHQIFKPPKGSLPKRSEQEMKICKPRQEPCFRAVWGVGPNAPEANLQDNNFVPIPNEAGSDLESPAKFPDFIPFADEDVDPSYARGRRNNLKPAPKEKAVVVKPPPLAVLPGAEAQGPKTTTTTTTQGPTTADKKTAPVPKKKAAVVEEQLEEENEQWQNQDDQEEEEEEEEEDEDEDEQDE
jgi:hypothetical protein